MDVRRRTRSDDAETIARIIRIPAPAARLALQRRQTRYAALDAQVAADQWKAADFCLEVSMLPKRLDVATSFAAVA